MKKLHFVLAFILLFVKSYSQTNPSTNENFIYTKTYLDDATASNPRVIEVVEYYNGLGRPKQIVSIKSSPAGNDIVSHISYDGFGRNTKQYLPVPQTGTQSGAIYDNPLANSNHPDIYNGNKIYSENILEPSSLGRITQSYNPGNEWNQNPVNYSYDVNSSIEVKRFQTTTSWVDNTTSSVLSLNGTYSLGQLSKMKILDEDQNEKVIFKNHYGQLVLIRKINEGKNIDTYYVYNEYGQIAFVIPPMAAVLPSVDLENLSKLCYQYRYDRKNRLVEKKLPAKDWEFMVYDKQDRLVLSQDPTLRTVNNNFKKRGWLFSKYDRFGRNVYSGFFANTASRSAMQNAINNMAANAGNNEIKSTPGFSSNGITIYYTKNAFPTGSMTILGVNYYDEYPAEAPAIMGTILDQEVLPQSAQNSTVSTKTFQTATYTKNVDDDNWTKDFYWYDTKGRIISSYSSNYLGGYTRAEIALDFLGVPQKLNTHHLRRSGEVGITVKERFIYDNQNRLLKHYHQVDNKLEELLSENSYNELSQLKNKKVGNDLQSIDYTYNIRGWLTHINKNDMMAANLNGKLFSYKIKYTEKEGITNPNHIQFPEKDVKIKFNGNITEIDWRSIDNMGSSPPITPKRYGYAYDNLDRLVAGYYQNPNNPYSLENTESVSYDLNGNIKNIYRTALAEYGNSTATTIDNLEYIYAGQDNKLTSIHDYTNNPTGYEGGGSVITYDINGNMDKMQDKGINQIAYNFLNLATRYEMITPDNSIVIVDNQYRADGIKLRKISTTSVPGVNGYTKTKKTTDYLDGFHYLSTENLLPGGGDTEFLMAEQETGRALERKAYSADYLQKTFPGSKNPELRFFPTAEGFYDYAKEQYIYQYKDQIGNSRVSFGRNSSGDIEITDNNDYYPFGMNHLNSGTSFFGLGSFKNYKFQEQELQETGFYSFKWRDYMPDVGRFFSIDPLSEMYAYQSHYNFSENRLIDARELEGLEKDQINDKPDGAKFDGKDYDGGVESVTEDSDGTHGARIQEVVLQGQNKDESSSSSVTIGSAARFGAGFVPFLGSGLDIYEGYRDGNWVQFGIGIGGLVLDGVSLGTASVIKGGVKSLGTHLVEEGIEKAAKEAAKEAAEQGAKSSSKIFRGGNSFTLSTADITSSVDKTTGLTKGTRGLSVNTNPADKFIDKYGGAWEVDLNTIPKAFKIKHTSGTHYEIVAPKGMDIKTYQNLLNKVEVKPFNSWPIK